jgi:hypothetical protein
MDGDRRTILVSVAEEQFVSEREVDTEKITRYVVPRELDAETVEDNMGKFLTSVQNILEKTPELISGFRFKEFTVTAEITADGQVSILGVGGGLGATGGLTFTFERATGDKLEQ